MGFKYVAQCDNCRKTEDCPLDAKSGRHHFPFGWVIEAMAVKVADNVVPHENLYCSDECQMELLQESMRGKAEALADQQRAIDAGA